MARAAEANSVINVRAKTWNGYNVQRYRSDNDNVCWPLTITDGSTTTTWVLAEGSPTVRFTGDVHTFTLNVPNQRVITAAAATDVQLWTKSGDDDLRGAGSPGDNADVTLTSAGGSTLTRNINKGNEWGNGQTHVAQLTPPPAGLPVQDIRSVTISTDFGGGIGGDNWNVDNVALLVGYPAGAQITQPPPIRVHDWLDAHDRPLIRFTGDLHDLVEPIEAQDIGQQVTELDLIISTGNDDLRGGGNAGDDCDVTIEVANGGTITLNNVNGGGTWAGWTIHTVRIPLPSGGLRGGESEPRAGRDCSHYHRRLL
jgi:hypothetical protein